MKKYKYFLKNLSCANCAIKIEDFFKRNSDFKNVSVNFAKSVLIFETDLDNPINTVTKAVNGIEPDVIVLEDNSNTNFKVSKNNLLLILAGIIFGIISTFMNNEIVKLIFIIVSYIFLLPKILIKAMKILIKNKSLDENILICISVIGAFLIDNAFEGFMVIALYQIGKLLEEMAVNKSKKSIKELMDIKPEFANIIRNKNIIQVNPEDVNIGDLIIVKNGEKIPLDGKVIKGTSYLDIKALTGESKPNLVKNGDSVLSGSINLGEVLEIKVTSIYENSTVSKILDLVENATNRKARTENFVSKAAKVYTPMIMFLAILTAVLFPVFTGLSVNESIYRALSFLVISCPCAIAISVPLSYFAGIGASSKHGILVKGSDYLDNLRKVKTIVFDKTGTLTKGEFILTKVEIIDKSYSKEEILKIAASGENLSNHPIAKSIVKAYSGKIDEVLDFKEIAGIGISYKYNKQQISIKSHDENDTNYIGTTVDLYVFSKLIATLILEDEVKNNAKKVIYGLNKNKIKTIMFTGDNKNTALSVSKKLNLNEVYYELLPTDKYKKLEELLKSKQNESDIIAFVGDGINDAPVLTLSDIGISMGSIGSSSAIEASDVVIMNDDLNKITDAFKISKLTTRIIKQNLIFALGTKLVFIILNLFGLSTMSWAVFADVGVTVLTVLNSIRILKIKI